MNYRQEELPFSDPALLSSERISSPQQENQRFNIVYPPPRRDRKNYSSTLVADYKRKCKVIEESRPSKISEQTSKKTLDNEELEYLTHVQAIFPEHYQ